MLYAEIIGLLQLWPWPWPWPGLVVELTCLGLGTCGLVNIPEDFCWWSSPPSIQDVR